MKLIRFQAACCLIVLYIASVATKRGEVDDVFEYKFDEFLRKHVIDPKREKGWEQWTSVQWNALLKTILGDQYGKAERRKHTFVIARQKKLLRTFRHFDKLETKTCKNEYTDREETMHWSENRFEMVYMDLFQGSYIPYVVLHEMQFLAALNKGKKGSYFPVHFQGQKSKKINLGGEMPQSLMLSPHFMTARQYAELINKVAEEKPKRKRDDEIQYDQNKYVKSK